MFRKISRLHVPRIRHRPARQPVRKSYIEIFIKNAGGMTAVNGMPGEGGLAVGGSTRKKNLQHLNKKEAREEI